MKSSSLLERFSARLAILFLVLVLGAGIAAVWWNDAISPVDVNTSESVIFVVPQGESVRSIASRLSEEELIRSATGFYMLVKIMGIERELQAGDFRLNRAMNARQIAEELTHGSLDVWVTTLEGWRSEEVANKLAKELDIPEQLFLQYVKEGYMFPDTYLIPREATPAAIAELFQDTFNARVTDTMRQDAARLGLTFEEVVVMASIVEREGRTDEDRPVIAGILLKRLDADWPLQADATLQYALGYQPADKTWWKKSLTQEDKGVRSAFNTYTNTGLPPAPISNPGLASIKAVLYPQETDFWYYLHDPVGAVHYGRTLEEHNENIANFLQ
jgi:UPF0755 protein